jgi:hypothetical protein
VGGWKGGWEEEVVSSEKEEVGVEVQKYFLRSCGWDQRLDKIRSGRRFLLMRHVIYPPLFCLGGYT